MQITAGSTPFKYPFRFSCPAIHGYVAVAGGWSLSSILTGQPFGHYVYNATFAQNDECKYERILLGSGIYSLDIRHRKDTNAGIMKVYVDGAEVASIDAYAGVAAEAIAATVTGIVIADGYHTISFKSSTKNAAASAYAIILESFCFFRTA
jgi:hypothetical protein